MRRNKMKRCYECKCLVVSDGEGAWSEFTPGWDASIMCARGHWSLDLNNIGGRPGLKKKLESAVNCPDFSPDPELSAIRERNM